MATQESEKGSYLAGNRRVFGGDAGTDDTYQSTQVIGAVEAGTCRSACRVNIAAAEQQGNAA